MHIYIYIFSGAVIVLAIGFVLVWFGIKEAVHNAKQPQKPLAEPQNQRHVRKSVDRWLDKIEAVADSDSEVVGIGAFPEAIFCFDQEARVQEALRTFWTARGREARRETMRGLMEQYEESKTPAAKANLCVKMYRDGYFAVVLGLPRESFGDRLVALLREELSAGRNGDGEALRRFLKFKKSHGDYLLNGVLTHDQQQVLVIPDDWDDMVTEFIENPSFDDFQHIQHRLASETIRQMAEEALATWSLKLGKFVLACCSKREYAVKGASKNGKSRHVTYLNRQAVGKALFDGVVKMVCTVQSERKLLASRA